MKIRRPMYHGDFNFLRQNLKFKCVYLKCNFEVAGILATQVLNNLGIEAFMLFGITYSFS